MTESVQRRMRTGLGIACWLWAQMAAALPATAPKPPQPPQPSSTEPLLTVGWVERVQLEPYELMVLAKMDTGADHSSLHAVGIQPFLKNGQAWMRFQTVQSVWLDAPFLRMAQIKTKNGGVQFRPVVALPVCLGNRQQTLEVNLVNRSHLNYPMLIGRSAMRDPFRVDPNQRFLTHPDCR
ncbi:MAG: ATP-dependent zinc protease [Hydrogenovibrio sp.]